LQAPVSRASHRLEKGIEVLAVSAFESDFLSLESVFEPFGSRVRDSATVAQALEFLGVHPTGVVISNVEFPDGTWEDLLEPLARLAPPPNLIVSSRLADERLWVDVLNLGGYDLVSVPFEAEEVLRVGGEAWRAYKSNSLKDDRYLD
jgi:DNA-binding NtrC family response regulator